MRIAMNSDNSTYPFFVSQPWPILILRPTVASILARDWECWGAGIRGSILSVANTIITLTNENTMMPSFYRVTGYNRILKKFDGKTILSAQEVEDIVAYLKTLTEEQ